VIFGRSNLANNNGQSIPKEKEFEHPDYDPSRSDNDFGLVILAEEVANARIVRLNEVDSYPSLGAVVTVAGWGDTTESDNQSRLSDEVMRVDVKTISNADCEDSSDGRGLDYFNQITENMLCATVNGGGKDACQVSKVYDLSKQSLALLKESIYNVLTYYLMSTLLCSPHLRATPEDPSSPQKTAWTSK
jgi:hypothetical protein